MPAPIRVQRPGAGEFAKHYQTYVDRVPDGDVVELLSRQIEESTTLLATVSEAKAGFRYAPDKWSIREVVGHLADSERVFSYRALRFARGDESPLASFDQDKWMPLSQFDRRPLGERVGDFRAVRQATLALLGSFDAAAFARGGTASGHRVTVRALAYVIAGHERHHIAILRERYGVGAPSGS